MQCLLLPGVKAKVELQSLWLHREAVVGVAETGGSFTVKGFPVVRVGNGDESLSPFRKVLVAKIHAAIFSHNILCLETGSYHSGPGSEPGHYLASSFGGLLTRKSNPLCCPHISGR